MASGPITSWQTGKKMETVTDFIFLGYKIMVDDEHCQEIKGHLFLGKKARTNLHGALKIIDITLLKNVCTVKAMFFHYSCMDVRRQRAKELMLFNCGAGEDS